jgi:hypothetical protein
LFTFRNKDTQILLTHTPSSLGGQGLHSLSHFWLAKEVNKEVKKKLQQCAYKNHEIL